MSLDTLSNLSYTNKDFNSIYSELLEYASKLSYKWDPVTSDESDPGVVLLKLAAIVADKDNYNIDKNILELMPASVTQLAAARQVFEQCGYTMPYYRSAVGNLQLTFKNEPDRDSNATSEYYLYEIPRFTMFSDIDKSVVFTSLEPAKFEVNESALSTEHNKAVSVIQGVIKDYTINGDTLITLANLDSRNRLYFTEMDIAENGIFISSSGAFSDIDEWKRVEVLELSDPSERCYRFGIDGEMTACYIEFSESIDKIIGEGLYIKYVRTSGGNGNVAAKRISQFFAETKAIRTEDFGLNPVEVDVTTDNIHIMNPLPITNGQDLETIDEAYRNYKRVKNTFDTLVSLTDYTDHMVSSKHASNGYVCDRTNDIQHTYKIVGENNVKRTKLDKVQVTKELTYLDDQNKPNSGNFTIEEPALTAFDLCVYGLGYKTTVTSENDYLSTFKLQSYKALRDNGGYIHYLAPEQTEVSGNADLLTQATLRCVEHDFKVEHATDTILMIKNKYPVTANIIPQYKLTQAQFQEVLANIQRSLFSALNAKMIDFGSPVSYDVIYEAISNADSRIRSVSLDYPTYQTYAVYLPSSQSTDQTAVTYQELRIDHESPGGYRRLSAQELTSLRDTDKVIYYDRNGEFNEDDWSNIDPMIKNTTVFYQHDEDLETLWNKFRTDIYAKSVLSGVTPLYTQDSSYMFGPNQYKVNEISSVVSLSTNTDIIVKQVPSGSKYESVRKLDVNENVLFTAPNYVTENQYSSYVKMIYDFPSLQKLNTLAKDSIYELSSADEKQDFIVFFWKASADDSDYKYMKYSSDQASRAKSICTTFNLPTEQDVATEALKDLASEESVQRSLWERVIEHFRTKETTGREETTSASQGMFTHNGITITETDLITKLASGNRFNVLTGAQTIYTKNPNTIQPNDRKNTSGDLFWILNPLRHIEENGVELAQLFAKDGEPTYTLQTGEYLLYTNPSKTTLHLLGSGTMLDRGADKSRWVCPVIEYSELSEKGPAVLENYWQTPKTILDATEMQQVQIGPGYQFSVSKVPQPEVTTSSPSEDSYTFSSTQTPLPSTAQISYTDGLTSTVLPAVPEGWTVQTLLNLNVGPNRPQKLSVLSEDEIMVYNQSITIKNSKDATDSTTIPDPNNKSTCYFLSTQELSAVGGQDIFVKSKSIFGEDPVRILTYTDPLRTGSGSAGVSISYPVDSFTCMLTAEPREEMRYNVPVSFLPGQYLLKLTCNVELSSLKLGLPTSSDSSASNDIETTSGSIEISSFPAGKEADVCYLYQVNVKDATYNGNIVVSFASTGIDTINIMIEPFYKYTASNLESIKVGKSAKSFETHLLSRIGELDYDNEFDYLHSVAETDEIVNPLASTAFLNPRHVMNPFTICQWNIDDVIPKIEILNNVR